MADEFDRIDEQPKDRTAAEQPGGYDTPADPGETPEVPDEAPAEEPTVPDAEPELPAEPEAEPEVGDAPGAEPEMPAEPDIEPEVPAEPNPAPDMSAAEQPAEVAAISASLDGPADATAADPAAPAEPPLMDLGPERRTAWWAWVLGILGVLAVVGVGWAVWYYLLSPVTVPRVVGKDLGEATQALNDAHVRLGRTSEEPTAGAPVGTVIQQAPKPGTEVDRGIEVVLIIAAPPTTTKVPDVKGQKVEDAQKALAGEELGTRLVETFDPAVAPGFVISQLPTSGADLPPGALVALAVSKGPAPTTATVPDLRGITPEEAEKVLAALELNPGLYRSNDPSVPAGQIATQTPAPGTRVNARSTVLFLVSEGRAVTAVTVPRVTDLSRKDALAKLKAAGFKAAERTGTHPSTREGNVIAQMPPAGARVARGSSIGILVSRGASDMVAVPSVVGTDQASAEKAFRSAGFRPVMVPVPVATGSPGQVVAQWPESGSSWTQFLPVVAIFREQ